MARIRVLVVVVVAVGLVVGLARPGEARTRSMPTCRGVPADHVVAPGEEWVGTEGDDVVVVIGPSAEVWTNFGDDLVCVHLEEGSHYGGSDIWTSYGEDTVLTYGGSNSIYTGADGDHAYLNGEHEYVDLDSGDDVAYGNGAVTIDVDAGDGNDAVVGSPNADFLHGELGNDVLRGSGGDDVVLGSEGNDQLHGNGGWDHLDGGAHVDSCFDHTGSEGADVQNCESVFLSPTVPGGFAPG